MKANILSTIQIKGKQREYGLVANTNRTMTWRDKGSYDDGYSTSGVILKANDEKRTVDIQYSYGLVEHDIPFCFFDSIDVINAEVVLIGGPIDLEKDSKKGKLLLWVDDVFCCLGDYILAKQYSQPLYHLTLALSSSTPINTPHLKRIVRKSRGSHRRSHTSSGNRRSI